MREASDVTGGGCRRLTQQDAFFVAYQEESGVSMQLGAELELSGELRSEDLEAIVQRLVERWPYLGQTVHRQAFGLAWRGPVRTDGMLVVGADGPSLDRWRNQAIDPFRERPFQLRWIPRAGGGSLALRAHHAALDGQSLMTLGRLVLRALAAGGRGRLPVPRSPAAGARPASLWRFLRGGQLGSMWRYMRWMKRESDRGHSARLAVSEPTPGDVAVHTRLVEGWGRDRLEKRARSLGVKLPWLCCAAWVRAIGAWNAERGESNPCVSLEVPVSTLRSRPLGTAELGNGISPLVLSSRADRPLDEVARELREQFVAGVRRRDHLAVPLFTAGGSYLPWLVFRRLAADNVFSGFATSHFTWMRLPVDPEAEIGRLSAGRLKLLSRHAYGPVCLHMGAAVLAIETPAAIQLSMMHRLNALPRIEAALLADLLMADLLPTERTESATREARTQKEGR